MGKTKPADLYGIIILKRKVRADGHQVCLCCVNPHDTFWSVIHVTPEGHIENAKSFIWSYDPKIKRAVQLSANREYRKWVQKLMIHNDDFDG